ncbi:amidohydrolase [Parerythrobacter aestuarii]|uniref:amidohydrolase n=1 Tax=Parerythrobacter aestuarii TaxID=3020909 RepID=UPI0024DECC98|nr:amidohydrolase family protein [Parerythrobacter aestuarii]
MLANRRAVLAGIAASPLLAATGQGTEITVFEARRIVTMESGLPEARFMAVANGMVLALAGTLDELSAWTGHRQHRVDRRFADKMLFPGLIDPHIHPMQSAVMLALPFLAPDEWHLPSGHWPGIVGQDAYRARLRKLVQEDVTDPLITWGHHELFHGPLGKAELDEIAPDRPLFVWQRSFHEIIANSAGLRRIGLGDKARFEAAMAAAKVEPGHGDYDTGVFSETALLVAIGKLQPVLLAPERMASGFAGLHQMMRERGVTTTSDMATGIFARFDTEAGLIASSFGRSDTAARVMLMPMAAELDTADDLDAWMMKARKYASDTVLLDRRVKLFADGAFFAQNMRMGPPGYADGHVGKWLTQPEDFHKQANRYWDAGFSLHIHVNGDEGLDLVLDAVAGLSRRVRQSVTLEHLGYCTEAQIQRIRDLAVMVSAQPNYIRVLGEAYGREGLGVDRASQMNRLGSLERYFVPLGLHSDFNMAPIDPFYLAWIAETREGIDGKVRAPALQLSREKALRAITIEAAQVIGMDSMIGSLAAGKKADFIALDSDPFEVEQDALKEMPIAATVFEGRV